jgi:LPS sulfotransferase NodH
MFVVIGAQRTGTNLLREILNTHEDIAMLGEIFSPSAAPAHWDNFLRNRSSARMPPASVAEAEELLDRYFEFVAYRIHNHWSAGLKSRSSMLGVDIKYNQLGRIAPAGWSSFEPPFLLQYFASRDVTLIHAVRANVIHCALSALIASQREVWHNYDGVVIDRSYPIDIEECLAWARAIVSDHAGFLEFAKELQIVTCGYEELLADIARASVGEEIPEAPGPLRDIARAFGVPFQFRYGGRLKKAINVPYQRLLTNYEEFATALKASEFSAFSTTLEETAGPDCI